jgi:competence protein ComEA
VSSHRDATNALSALRRWELNATAVRALAAVAVLIAVGAGVVAWRARPSVEPVAPSSVNASTQPDVVVVAVAGRVVRPGLVRLPAGARVADALEAAGGPLPGTDLSTLNLARKVVDGELITVGVPPPSGSTGDGLVNLNTATLEQL